MDKKLNDRNDVLTVDEAMEFAKLMTLLHHDYECAMITERMNEKLNQNNTLRRMRIEERDEVTKMPKWPFALTAATAIIIATIVNLATGDIFTMSLSRWLCQSAGCGIASCICEYFQLKHKLRAIELNYEMELRALDHSSSEADHLYTLAITDTNYALFSGTAVKYGLRASSYTINEVIKLAYKYPKLSVDDLVKKYSEDVGKTFLV
jgi:hypothetical protein